MKWVPCMDDWGGGNLSGEKLDGENEKGWMDVDLSFGAVGEGDGIREWWTGEIVRLGD